MIITVFRNIFDTTDPLHIDVLEILKRIKDGNSKDIVNKIREEKDKDAKGEIKKRLPSICFSGRFSKRKAEFLLEHSGLICLDVDDLKIKDLKKIKSKICDDDHVFACFISPSGLGLKIIIKIHPDKAEHKSQFLALEHHFNNVLSTYGACVDKSGKDVGRVCYESYDDDMFYNPDSEIWIECRDEEIEQKEVEDHDQIIEKLQKWIDAKESYFKGNRNSFIYKFASALCRYGVGQMRTLSYLQGTYSDLPFTELKTTVNSAYKSNDFRSQFFTKAELRSRITKVKGSKDKEVTAFWTINDKGRVVIDPKQFLNFITANGFGIYRQQKGDKKWSFVQVSNMVVDVVDVMDIKHHILKYVEEHAPEPVFAELQMKNRYFENTFLNALPVLDVEQIRDNQKSSFVFFEDFYFEIFAEKIEKHDYVDLKGRHIWRTQMSKKSMTDVKDYKDHDFNKFVWNATGKNKQNYDDARAALGYLMHTYKKRRLAKLIYACDMSTGELDGMANGGTGKNLFFESMKFVRSIVDIDGKDFDKRDKFKFQTVQDDTQMISIDDYEGNIKELFTRVTGHFEVERKGLDKVVMHFDDAPKIMVSSNTSPTGFSQSFKRRLHLVEFSDHYNSDHTPADEFGDRDFFSDDWNQDDYDCLYSFLFGCIQQYLKLGLTRRGASDETKFKQVVLNTGHEFAEYMEGQKLVEFINARYLFEDYIKNTGDVIRQQDFYSKLRLYCGIQGWELNEKGRGLQKDVRILKPIKND
tara:strand:+ start:4628 stop:6883 length:2256 start_codon:yes stop_codon:yes gene_type:complete